MSQDKRRVQIPELTINDVEIPPPKNPEKFERLVCELQQAEDRNLDLQLNGRTGQRQNGVDVVGRSADLDGWVGLQCKVRNSSLGSALTVEDIRDEVKRARKFKPSLTRYIIATTAPRNASLQEEARRITDRHHKQGFFSVHILSWDDISLLVSKHGDVRERYYGNYMFPSAGVHQPLLAEPSMQDALNATNQFSQVSTSAPDLRVLSAPAARALELLATSPLPLPKKAYEEVFQDISWTPLIAELVRSKLVVVEGTLLMVSESTKRVLFPSLKDRNALVETWLRALEPFREHVDMALVLSLQHLAAGRRLEALDIVLEMAEYVERGFWNELYISFLEPFKRRIIQSKLTEDKKRAYYSAYGICLVRSTDPAKAIQWAVRLLKSSVKHKDHSGVSQAYLLLGLASQYLNKIEAAATYYELSAGTSKRHRNYFLYGHALHNLAMMRAYSNPDEAANLLELSIAAKAKSGDNAGKFGALFGRGTIAISQSKFKVAHTWFSRAEKFAARHNLSHSQALSLFNIGRSLVDLGRPRDALRHYAKAISLSEAESFFDVLARALGGAASANLALNRFQRAHNLFLRLKSVQEDLGDRDAAACAFHDAGACLLFAGKANDARLVLSSAYEEAVKFESSEWIYRCAKDIALSYRDEGNDDRALEELRLAAIREDKNQRHWVSAKLWETFASVAEERDPSASCIERAFIEAVRTLDNSVEHVDEKFRYMSGLFQHRWEAGQYEGAIDALRELEHAARQYRDRAMLASARDQIGQCLQQLGRGTEAISFHRSALQIARRMSNSELLEGIINNLGEAYRQCGKAKVALPLYLEAERVARQRRDVASEIGTAHNRALALEALGRLSQAKRVLVRCRERAFSNELWGEYVRALHGLANYEWLSARVDAALAGYREALAKSREYELDPQSISIAINFANALGHVGRCRESFRMLKSLENCVPSSIDRHGFYLALATSALDVDELSEAKRAFLIAIESSDAAKDTSSLVSGYCGIAQLFEGENDWDASVSYLNKALALNPPDSTRAAVLVQQLRVQLSASRTRQANKVFRQIQGLAKTASVDEAEVDAYIILGDAHWEIGKSKSEALRPYIAALNPAFEIGLEVMVQTGIHAVLRLLSLEGHDRVAQMERIQHSLWRWIAKSNGGRCDVDTVFLWPCRVAIRIARESRRKSLPPEKAMVKLLDEEIFGRTAKSKSSNATKVSRN